jgi:hypothetical protein
VSLLWVGLHPVMDQSSEKIYGNKLKFMQSVSICFCNSKCNILGPTNKLNN